MDKRRQRTREAIETAFVELINERGYAKTTVQDILERSGVGRATFYAQFHSKDDLLEAQVCALCDHALDMGAATPVSPLVQTERVLENLLDRRGGLHSCLGFCRHERDRHTSRSVPPGFRNAQQPAGW